MSSGAAHSNIEWRAYGAIDYGASHELEKGRQEWEMLQKHLRQYGLEAMRTCVEIGCGAGRLTSALAPSFTRVHALDVSEDRLQQARHATRSENVEFHLVDVPHIPLQSDCVDVCISTHVFQHISSEAVIQAYLKETYRVLKPNGCMLIHFPVLGAHGTKGNLWECNVRSLKNTVKAGVLAITRILIQLSVRRLPWRIDYYRFFNFPDLYNELATMGFRDVEMRLLPWDGGHSYFFARK